MNPNNIRLAALDTLFWFCDELKMNSFSEREASREIEDWFNTLIN
jgi:hypothetical protein